MKDVNQKWSPRTLTAMCDGDSTPSPSLLQSIPPVLWSLVYQWLQPLIELNMGAGECHVIQWAHKFFSECATSHYLSSEDQIQYIYMHLADYFSGKYANEKGTTCSSVCVFYLFFMSVYPLYDTLVAANIICLPPPPRGTEWCRILTIPAASVSV